MNTKWLIRIPLFLILFLALFSLTPHSASAHATVAASHASTKVSQSLMKPLSDPNDPYDSGCNWSKNATTPIRGISGGTLYIWWSTSCQTNWAVATYPGTASLLITLGQVRSDSGGPVQCYPTSCVIGDWYTGRGQVWTDMIYSPDYTACARVWTPQYSGLAPAAIVCM